MQEPELAYAFFHHAPVGLAVADLAGRYVAANAAFLAMLGYSAEELRARTVDDLVHPQDARESRRTFEEVAAGARSPAALELRCVRKDGLELWVRGTAARVPGSDGEPRYVLAMVEDMHALSRRLVEAEELERHRIAGELHDRVGQQLSALNINLDIAQGLAHERDMELRVRLADSMALLEAALQSIENVMAELRPPLLAEYGVAAALGAYAQGFSQRTGVQVAVDDPGELARDLPRETSIALFRIAQEALANVAKHAQARRVKILLERDGEALAMDISDDGRGFEPEERLAQAQRWGVSTMQERAAAIGGAISVASAPAAGTTVRVRFPAAA